MKASGCEVELSRNRFTNQEAFVSHANATLTPITRLRLARLVVDGGWTYSAAATIFMVAPRTAKKWAERYRLEGSAGMTDRSSRPHRSPTRTPTSVVRAIVRLRWRHRLGPVQIGGRLGMPASTVHAVLVRCRVNRLSRIDRVTGEPLRCYEHDRPGSLIHVDVTKFANIPDGGGWRYVGRRQGRRNGEVTARRTGQRGNAYRPLIGTAYLHTVIDDHSRVAYVEICSDEKAGAELTGPVDVAFRPEQVLLGPSTGGAHEGVVDAVDYFGHDALVRLRLPSGPTGPECVIRSRVVGDDAPAPGQLVHITVRGPVLAFEIPGVPPAGEL